MGTLYVKELFGVLRFLGIEQQQVVTAVGPNKAQVSLWAHGKRPVPKKLTGGFIHFVAEAITAKRADVWRANTRPPHDTLLSMSPAERFDADLKNHLERWALECYEALGTLQREHARHVQTQRRYQHLNPSKLTVEELNVYLAATNGVSRTLRAALRLKTGADMIDGRFLSPPLDKTPVDYFWFIAQQFQRGESQEEEDDSET